MKTFLLAALFVGAMLSIPKAQAQQSFSSEEAHEIAQEAYIYAYPMILADVTRNVMTNVAEAAGLRGPMNQISHTRAFPDASFTDVVRPDADTLYSVMHFDVSKEPMVFSIPDSGGRYYLLPMLDMWSDVFTAPGKRTTGTGAQTFAVVGPRWRGQLSAGMTEYRSPTAIVTLIGRTQTDGKADYPAVHEFQDRIKAVPFSAYGKPYTPPKATVNPNQDMGAPRDQVERMDAETFFSRFAELLKDNPPHANDYPILSRMKRIGLEAGKSFSLASAPEEVHDALNAAPVAALDKIKASVAKSGVLINGWRIHLTAIGTYGTDYLLRAGIAYAGLGSNTVQDAVYATVSTDASGAPLRSDRRYVLHFDKSRIPPSRAFWSLTMYNERQLFAANPIDRYAIGARDELTYNPNGSLDLHIQRESPGNDKEANWLPAPASGAFMMSLRLYWPEAQVLDGTWKPPPVRRAD